MATKKKPRSSKTNSKKSKRKKPSPAAARVARRPRARPAKKAKAAKKKSARKKVTRFTVERLSFDGYFLRWHAAQVTAYTAFSGLADESARESSRDSGPIPQGRYTIDPSMIQDMPAGDHAAWGTKRVWLQPQRATVDRMRACFEVRTNMYIHGGNSKGTIGCIEVNDPAEHRAFFDRLATYGTNLDIEVKYVGDRETKYEAPACPY